MSKPLELKSGVSKNFYKSFVLDRDCLTRMASIVERAAKALNIPTAVVFHVSRKDDRFFETPSLEDVFNDPNVDGKQISTLAIELRDTNPERRPEPWEHDWIVRLSYDYTSDNQVLFEIFYDAKDWALLLADELQPQIERTLKCERLSSWILLPFYGSVAGLAAMIAVKLGLLSLDYRQWKILPDAFTAAFLVALTTALVYLGGVTVQRTRLWTIRLFGAESVYLWGDQERSYKQRDQVRGRIQGAVLVGFFLSLLTNAIVAILATG